MRIHLKPMLTAPEPSPGPALTLVLAFIAAASVAGAVVQIVARAAA